MENLDVMVNLDDEEELPFSVDFPLDLRQLERLVYIGKKKCKNY